MRTTWTPPRLRRRDLLYFDCTCPHTLPVFIVSEALSCNRRNSVFMNPAAHRILKVLIWYWRQQVHMDFMVHTSSSTVRTSEGSLLQTNCAATALRQNYRGVLCRETRGEGSYVNSSGSTSSKCNWNWTLEEPQQYFEGLKHSITPAQTYVCQNCRLVIILRE